MTPPWSFLLFRGCLFSPGSWPSHFLLVPSGFSLFLLVVLAGLFWFLLGSLGCFCILVAFPGSSCFLPVPCSVSNVFLWSSGLVPRSSAWLTWFILPWFLLAPPGSSGSSWLFLVHLGSSWFLLRLPGYSWLPLFFSWFFQISSAHLWILLAPSGSWPFLVPPVSSWSAGA